MNVDRWFDWLSRDGVKSTPCLQSHSLVLIHTRAFSLMLFTFWLPFLAGLSRLSRNRMLSGHAGHLQTLSLIWCQITETMSNSSLLLPKNRQVKCTSPVAWLSQTSTQDTKGRLVLSGLNEDPSTYYILSYTLLELNLFQWTGMCLLFFLQSLGLGHC